MNKRILTAIILIALTVTQLFVPSVFADRDDLIKVADELHKLNDAAKQSLLSELWDIGEKYVGEENLSGKIDAIYDDLLESLEKQGLGNVISTDSVPGDGKISEASVKMLIEKAVDHRYRAIIEDIYEEYEVIIQKSVVKAVLGVGSNATQGEVFAAILAMKIPVLKTENGQFVRNGDVADKVAEKLASKILNMNDLEKGKLLSIVPKEMKSLFETILKATNVSVLKPIIKGILTDASDETDRGMDINAKVDKVAEKLNDKLPYQGVTRNDVIKYLKLYGLYEETTVTPPGGDDTPSTPSTPTTPTTPGKVDEEQERIISEIGEIIEDINEEDIASASEDELAALAENISGKLAEAAQLIASVEDAQEAADLAKELIKKSGALVVKLDATNNTAAYDTIVKDVKQLANTVMNNAGALAVDAENITSADGKVTAQVIFNKDVEDKLDLIVSIAKELNQAATEAGIDEEVAAPALYLDATTDADNNSASVEIPSDLILAIEAKGIARMVVATDVAVFTVPSSAIDVEAGAVIKLNSDKVDASVLSDDAKEAVGSAPVFDLYITINDERVSNFNSLIGVSVPYTLNPGENPEKVTVFYINEEGQLENVIGVYNEETQSVYFETSHFSLYIVKVNNVTFEDVDSKFWASNYIEVMASKGVIKGVGDGSKFAPLNNVTRAEFVAMIVREFKLFDETAPNNFKDVSEKDWFYPEVTAAAKLGIIQGRPGGVFAPNDKITREEMAKVLSNVLVMQLGKKAPANPGAFLESFTDSDLIADYAKDAVAIGVRYGMFSGRPDGTFAPKDNADRAEAAKLIYMLFHME